jgi:hypothetical protein
VILAKAEVRRITAGLDRCPVVTVGEEAGLDTGRIQAVIFPPKSACPNPMRAARIAALSKLQNSQFPS